MKIWIDLSNSPHPLLFAPLARRFEEAGATVMVTVRDNAQTLELASQRWDRIELIGRESPAGRIAKARTMANRVGSLLAWAGRAQPDVALSHNSYGQAIAGRALGIPVVTAMDFEHQPANHVAFRAAQRILLPEALTPESVRSQGATPAKIVRYPGLKEELYLGDFVPNPSVLGDLGMERSNGSVLVVARTPPGRAAYHRFGNPLFARCLETLAAQEHVRTIVMPRHDSERRELQERAARNVVVTESAIDSRSLIREADLMVGAGGTMTREAALMGVPTYTVFAGQRPAVDSWLEQHGRLSVLESPEQLADVAKRPAGPAPMEQLRERGRMMEDIFVETTLEAAGRGL